MACCSCRRTGSARSCSRCRWSGSGGSARSPRPSCTRSASARWPTPRRSARRASSRSSAGPRAGTSTRWRAGSTRARSTPPGAAARSARNRRSVAAPAAMQELDAILAGTLDRLGRRLREGHRTARTVVLRLRFDDFSRATRSHSLAEATAHTATLLEAARVLLRGALPMIHERGITLLGISLVGPRERPQRPARPPVRRAERARHRWRARCCAAAIRQPIGGSGHPIAPPTCAGNPPIGRLAMPRCG